uniref:Peptidase S1 domain-containing protein n=1 Tax=Syphacia muris TaxID=451379 RepID=A0A0N5AVL2_9BILA
MWMVRIFQFIDAHRLVGAHACRPNAWPWTAELVARHGGHRCGAALIDAHYIVTAAHCFSIVDPQDYNVLLGGHLTGTGQKHLVKKFAIHPFYNLFQPSSYDVAIARIYPAANFSSTVNKVCLPIMPPPDNKICVVTGWGFDKEDGNRSNVLKEIHVPIIPSFLCNDLLHYQGRVHYPSMLCAGYNSGGIDACQGDSGGPLFCENFGRWELHGIVSWGNGCGRPYNPGVYSKIAPVVPWLRFQMYVLR